MLMVRDEAAITQTYTDSMHAFQTLNPPAGLSYCHVPCMLIAPQAVCVMATLAEVEALFTHVLEELKTRNYARSGVTDLHVQQMSEHIAFLSVSRVRYTIDGHERERLGEMYTFRKTDDGWKIVVATMHDPQTILRLA